MIQLLEYSFYRLSRDHISQLNRKSAVFMINCTLCFRSRWQMEVTDLQKAELGKHPKSLLVAYRFIKAMVIRASSLFEIWLES